MDAQFRADGGALLSHAAIKLRRVPVFLKGDADGVRANAREMALAIDVEAIPCRERLDGAVDAMQEVIAMRLDVEADQVGAEHPVNQVALPGADAEDLRIGPGNMPENGDPGVRARFLDHAGEQGEMIVLGQNDGRLDAFHFFEKGVGETPIDLLIGDPVLRAENWARVS